MTSYWIVYLVEVIVLTKEKRNKKELEREEFGYGYDISPDDLGVIGKNNQAKKQNVNENKEKTPNKKTPELLNE